MKPLPEAFVQCVIGAVFNSFAYRHPELASSLRIFGVDHLVTLARKQTRNDETQLSVPPNVVPRRRLV
jgi:O-methyltransferase involved in polyketide biosynthesis